VQGSANRVVGAGAQGNVLGDVSVSDSGNATVTGDNYAPITITTTVNGPTAVTQTATWLKPGEYLRRMNKGEIFTHHWRLAGRAEVMRRLLAFANDEKGRVGLLTGRPGVGKTKVLTALCDALAGAQPPVAVRVLDGFDTDQQAFQQLPRTGKLLVVIDDAHNQTIPLGKIITGVQDANGAANVLLSLRPYGEPHIRRELARVLTHTSEAVSVDVGDLEFDDAVGLACEVLHEAAQGYAPRLAAAARDCPLLIVTGAALINRGALDPDGFEGDATLHVELTHRLADALTADAASEAPRQNLLYAVAAFQPLRLNEPAAAASLEALTGLPADAVALHLAALEQAGVLLRHGAAVRVVPDLLGDALLIKAARHQGTGVPTGYLGKALEAAKGSALPNLVVNAGRVDWQDRDTRGNGLIEPVWTWIEEGFKTADAHLRVLALGLVAKVAFFQPRRALDLVSWAIANPSEPVAADLGLGMELPFDDASVRRALPPVLQFIAYHPEFLPQAAGLLWALGRDDPRPTHSHPDHALRVLGELIGFTRYGPTDHQRILVSQVERWLNRESADPAVHQPLAVLTPLLATEGHDEVWCPPDTLGFHPYVVPPSPEVLEVRTRALKLAFAELGSSHIERAAAAVKLIGAAVTLPRGGFGLTVTPEMLDPWIPHLASVIGQLHHFIEQRTLAPAILVAVRTELQWHSQHGPDGLRVPASEVLAAIPTTVDNELARALHGGPVDRTGATGSEFGQVRQNLLARTVGALATWSDGKVVSRISTLLGDEQRAFPTRSGSARAFVWELVSQRPSVGEALCEHALSWPSDPLVSVASTALIAMGRSAGDRALHWGQALAADGSVELVREVAHAFGIQRGRSELLEGEAELLRDLAAHEDDIVHGAALGAALSIGVQHKDLAIELLTASFRDQADINTLANALAEPPLGSLSWSDLTEPQQASISGQLTTYPSLDDYDGHHILAEIARTDPLKVVKLLEARVEAYEASVSREFHPLPYTWQVTPPFRSHETFPSLLRQVGDWLAAAPDSAMRNYLGAPLFALVAGPYDAHVIALFDEYLADPDPLRLKVLGVMVRKAPRDLVWDHGFVRRCLRAADRYGEGPLKTMRGELYASVVTGTRWGTMGQPYPEDVEQYDRATALAGRSDKGSVEELFYRDLAESAEHRMKQDRHDLPPDHRSW
jgi:hypothetical protein